MAKQTQKGWPEHGSEYKEEDENLEMDENQPDDDEDESEVDEKDEEGEKKPPKESLEERIARLEGENAALRSAITRPQDVKPPKKEEEPEPDWEKMLYDDPKAFVSTLSGRIAKQVSTELGTKYQRDQGEKEFWSDFYSENDDLREDRDLVQATLSSNLNILGDMPVSQARKKLADLTRERIMRYTGKREKKDGEEPKARVEGARSPRAPQKPAKDDKVVTLSDIIRNRRANRMKARTA